VSVNVAPVGGRVGNSYEFRYDEGSCLSLETLAKQAAFRPGGVFGGLAAFRNRNAFPLADASGYLWIHGLIPGLIR
jgi:hypothetical protein